jgi:sugar phosphate isomerase/epimerase
MRLGGALPRPETVAELDATLEKIDGYGLSTIMAPRRFGEMPVEEAEAFGARAAELDLVIGEAVPGTNLMTRDLHARAQRIESLRAWLVKADRMGCRSVVVLIGSVDASDRIAAPHPYMFTDECRAEFREVVLRVLDGLELAVTRLLVEPWNTSFFYRPRDILAFLESVDDPRLGVHLDQMNMVDQDTFYCSTELINQTFDLLAPHAGSVHFKDIAWDSTHMFLKFDEVLIGDGVLDYRTYLSRLFGLGRDLTCYCEHLQDEAEYATNFERLHRLADELGFAFRRRNPVNQRPRGHHG